MTKATTNWIIFLGLQAPSWVLLIWRVICFEVWKSRFDLLRLLPGFEAVYYFAKTGGQVFPGCLSHTLHHLAQRFWVILQPGKIFEFSRHGLETLLLGFGNAHLRHAAAYIGAVAMHAMDGLLSVFAVGQKYIEAFRAGVADEVVGGHKAIVAESGTGAGEGVWYNCTHV